MRIYRDLFFNNVSSLLAGTFPVLRRITDDDAWRDLVRDFYTEHHCHTPLFPEVAREFVRYLQDEREPRPSDPPFLSELAHYEWIELALEIDERSIDTEGTDPEGDPVEGVPVTSPLVHVLAYRFPVHRIGPDYRPDEAPEEASHFAVYRDRSDTVKFMSLNAMSFLLLNRLQENSTRTGRQLLEHIAAEIGHPEPGRIVEAGAGLLADFHERDILLGARK